MRGLFHIETDFSNFKHSHFIRVNKKDIYKFAVPKLLERFLKNLNLFEN